MTNFLKTSALIAFLLSSFSIPALAEYETGKSQKVALDQSSDHKVALDLFSKIMAKKASGDRKVEQLICSQYPKYCDQNSNLTNKNIGNDLNNEDSNEALELRHLINQNLAESK